MKVKMCVLMVLSCFACVLPVVLLLVSRLNLLQLTDIWVTACVVAVLTSTVVLCVWFLYRSFLDPDISISQKLFRVFLVLLLGGYVASIGLFSMLKKPCMNH